MLEKLRKNNEFRTVYRRGRSFSNDLLVLYVFNNRKNKYQDGEAFNKVGISVSKKVGKSVIRSRVKRLISESYRLNSNNIVKGNDFVFIARVNINGKSYKDVERSMKNLFKKANLYEKSINSSNKVL